MTSDGTEKMLDKMFVRNQPEATNPEAGAINTATIQINMGGQVMVLTVDQAKELKRMLANFFPDPPAPPAPIVVERPYIPPLQPPQQIPCPAWPNWGPQFTCQAKV